MSKTRLDVAMAAQGLAESRQKAQAIIMSGLVFVDGKRVDKCGTQGRCGPDFCSHSSDPP